MTLTLRDRSDRMFFGKWYHWAIRKGRLHLHKGHREKCRRVFCTRLKERQ